MIGITNVGGSGGGNAFAYIGVTYPVGATVTCTNGMNTLRTRDTSGLYVFPVPYAATWTIYGTDGIDSFTQNVTITSKWQNELVKVKFWDGELFWNGNQYTSVTGGWYYDNRYGLNSSGTRILDYSEIGNTITVKKMGNSGTCTGIMTRNKIDLSNAVSISVEASGIHTSGLPSTLSGNGILIVADDAPGTTSNPKRFTANSQYTDTEGFLNLANGSNTLTLDARAKGNMYIFIFGLDTTSEAMSVSKIKINFAS